MLTREEFNRQLGERIRLARKTAKLKAEQVARETGVSIQFFSDVECGRKGMSGYNVAQLAKVLQVSTDFLLSGTTVTNEKWVLMEKRIVNLSPVVRETAADVLNLAVSIMQASQPDPDTADKQLV